MVVDFINNEVNNVVQMTIEKLHGEKIVVLIGILQKL